MIIVLVVALAIVDKAIDYRIFYINVNIRSSIYNQYTLSFRTQSGGISKNAKTEISRIRLI